MKRIFVLGSAIALSTACGKKVTTMAPQPSPQKQTQSQQSQAQTASVDQSKDQTPAALFKARFSKVDTVCDVYVLDKSDVETSDQPQATLTLPTFPIQETQTVEELQSASGQIQATVTLDVPSMEALNMDAGNDILGQVPIVEVTGKIATTLPDGTVTTSDLDALLFTNSSTPLFAGGASIDSDLSGTPIKASGSVYCHLVEEKLPTATNK